MMKLKHLFNNEDLALMALKCWDYDQDSLELFKYYRISANALYPFKNNGRLQYLPFSPVKEKPYGLEGEIEFLTYLKSEGYPVVELISSKNNHMIEEISTPWGHYYAVETLKAFNSIYKYTRLKRSLKDKWHNEPEWMMHLRDRLENYLEQVPSTITI